MIISNAAKLVQGKKLPDITPDASIQQACQVLTECEARALVVTNQHALVGVISEQDIVRKCVAKGLDVAETKVTEVMSSGVSTIEAEDSVAQAIQIMQQGHFHHVPVMQAGQVIGLISSDDIPDEYRMLLEHFKEMRAAKV